MTRVCGGRAIADRQGVTLFARGPPAYRPPPRRRGWPRRRLGVAYTPPDALPPPRVLYERHPSTPETEVAPQRPLIRGCQILDVF